MTKLDEVRLVLYHDEDRDGVYAVHVERGRLGEGWSFETLEPAYEIFHRAFEAVNRAVNGKMSVLRDEEVAS